MRLKLGSTKITAITLLSLLVTTQFPLQSFAQAGVAYELSAEKETWVTENLSASGVGYTMVTYPNGEVIILDMKGELVTTKSTLEEVYGIKSFKILFAKNNLTSTEVGKIKEALDSLNTNAKLVNDIMTIVTIAAAAAGIASIFVGGVAIPIALVVGAVKVTTQYVVENTEKPKSTSVELVNLLTRLEGGNMVLADYKQALTLAVKLREQIKDLNSKLILQVTGLGSIAYHKALSTIADTISNQDLKKYAASVEKSQTELDNSLKWLDRLDVDNIKQLAITQTNEYMRLQTARIESRKKLYESTLNSAQGLIAGVKQDLTVASRSGIDASVPLRLLSEIEPKIKDARNHATNYEYRSAMDLLAEATSSLHQIEVMLKQGESKTRPDPIPTSGAQTTSISSYWMPAIVGLVMVIVIVIYMLNKRRAS